MTHRRVRATAGALLVVGAIGLATRAGAQSSETALPAFAATAAAQGAKVSVIVPGGPIQDNLVEAGGPTAQSSLDSLGNSKGYAAFPDPGSLVISVPGLVAGLLAGGLGPIPPVEVPTLPNYPFAVSSDAAVAPEASAGAGPYALRAASTARRSQASGTAGLELAGVANTGLARSTTTIERSDSEVTVSATTQIEGVTLGPLTLGQIRSTATLTMDADGQVTPTTDMAISGARIGGVAIDLTPSGLDLAGPSVPLPITPVLEAILGATGIKVEIEPGQVLADGITSPALRISTQFDASSIGKGQGTVSVVLGDASVHLGSPSGGPVDDEADLGTTEGTEIVVPDVSSGGFEVDGPVSLPPAAPPASTITDVEAQPLASQLSFDISAVYLGLLILGGLLLLSNQFLRLFAVRSP